MKNIWKYLIPAMLGIIIGLLLYPYIFGEEKPFPIIQPPETSILPPEPVKPDTVRIIKYVKIPAKPHIPIVTNVTVVASTDDEIETAPGIPYYESEINLFYDATMTAMPKLKADSTWLAKTTTWAYSMAPVDSFKQDLVVHWNLYYERYVEPTYNYQLEKTKQRNLFKGLAAGAIAVAGMAYGEWYVAVPALASSVFIVFYF